MRDFETATQTDQGSNTIPYVKIILGIILLITLFSHDQLDPSPLNLLWPVDDIGNWLGLPGALASGFLTEIFGQCGFLVPVFLLVFNHKDTINKRQAFLLDSAVITLLTIGLSQLAQAPDVQLTGLLGTISNIHLEQFPGKLITILIVAGFVVRYSRHYTPNLHFIVMMRHSGLILLAATAYSQKTGKTILSKFGVRLERQFTPFSTVSKQKLTLVKRNSIRNWTAIAKKLGDLLLEINPFHRLPSEKTGKNLTLPMTDEMLNELTSRQLLKNTIQEFEKRTSSANA